MVVDISFSNIHHTDTSSDASTETPQCDETFEIVLVDIKKAAKDKQIYCVKKPLLTKDDDLKFVALSYRWGDLRETVVKNQTNLGYLATVRSFDLIDFCRLCDVMTRESDLKTMKYVWVDAICINQTDRIQRKATIYQMNNIYNRANYIVAVPDLHFSYLMDVNRSNGAIIAGTRKNRHYIYNLIHQNTDRLAQLEEQWLDEIELNAAPTTTRQQVLANYENRAVEMLFVKPRNISSIVPGTDTHFHDPLDNNKYMCGSEFHTYRARDGRVNFISSTGDADQRKPKYYQPTTKKEHDMPSPFALSSLSLDDNKESIPRIINAIKTDEWKRLISTRIDTIRKSLCLMEDVLVDWSSRVWVISEYSIAKKKNNKMKYWFLQLGTFDNDDIDFFEFDFDKQDPLPNQVSSSFTSATRIFYQNFHETMVRQLKRQTFLEMMLKSMASKHEDRFYSILPGSKYHNEMASRDEVDSWKIHSLTSVKLKLFKFMDVKDKIDLLFLAGNTDDDVLCLPTFATSLIKWTFIDNDFPPAIHRTFYNFDMDSTHSITLIERDATNTNEDGDDWQYKLYIKPKKYVLIDAKFHPRLLLGASPELRHCLQFHDSDPIHCVVIWDYVNLDPELLLQYGVEVKRLYLLGNLAKNKWVISRSIFAFISTQSWPRIFHECNEHSTGFYIY